MKFNRLLMASLILASSLVYAEEQEDLNPAGEVGKATMGRVFGVAGDGGDIDYFDYELHEHTPRNAGVRSALVPGWGQGFNNEQVKGVVLGLTFFASAYGSITYHHKSKDSYDDYTALGVAGGDRYDDYKSELTYSSVLGGLALVLWGYSIVDASRGAYRHLYSSDHRVDLAFSDGNPELRYSQRF